MKEIIEEFKELVRIPSPSLGERAMADVLTLKLRELGLSVYEDHAGEKIGGNAGNLYAVLPATGPEEKASLLLCAHMDRVPNGDNIQLIETNETITSDGTTILAADDLTGVCAILDGVRRVLKSGAPHGRVEIVFTVCEEYETKGAKNLETERLMSKTGYCLDSCGRFGRIIRSAPRIDHFTLRIFGKKAHAGQAPETGIDALKAAARVIATLREGRIDEETTANIGVIRAGEATNIICDEALLLGEVRSRNPGKAEQYEAYLREHIEKETEGLGVRTELAIRPDTDAFSVDPSEEVVQELLDAIKRAGGEGYSEHGGGGMDANTLNRKGITTVGVATGYLRNHTKEEILYKDDLIRAGKMVEELIRNHQKTAAL